MESKWNVCHPNGTLVDSYEHLEAILQLHLLKAKVRRSSQFFLNDPQSQLSAFKKVPST